MSQRHTSPDAGNRRHEPHRTTQSSSRPTREHRASRTRTTGQSRTSNQTRTAGQSQSRTASKSRTASQTHSSTQQQLSSQGRRSRSVGATTLAAPRARSFGMPTPDTRRRYGRGETVRKVEEGRMGSVYARPAVYTQEPRRTVASVSVPAFAIPLAIVLVAVVTALILAGPVRTYYAAWREAGVLEAEYEALAQQNAELMEQLDRLQSLDGIEDEARRRGYAYPDEEVLVVDGLEEEKLADPAKVDEAIEAHEANQPWYVGFLDALFGYERT